MSVLIKGMEMPKNCYGCPFFKQVDYWNKNDEADILSKCKRTGEFTWESVNGYLPNCPLVPIPLHGRLIDADALNEAIENSSNRVFTGVTIADALKILTKESPTIIQTEEGET